MWIKFAHWWLGLTSAGYNQPQETIDQREKARRSRLTSWILFTEVLAILTFIPGALSDKASGFVVPFSAVVLLIEIFLNRKGFVTAAGALLVLMTCLGIVAVIVGSPDGRIHLVYLPALDLLVIAVILGASILPRIAAFVIAFINIVFIYSILLLQPWSPDLHQAINQYGMPVIAGRPVALQIIAAVLSYLWLRGMDLAIKRADRAEEIEKLQQYINQVETERKQYIEEFVRHILNAIEALANGQEGIIVLPAQHPLQQQAIFVNKQLKQFYRLKRSNNVNNEQTAYAAQMLLAVLQRINKDPRMLAGLDLQHFSTQVPVIDEIAKYLFFFLQRKNSSTESLR